MTPIKYYPSSLLVHTLLWVLLCLSMGSCHKKVVETLTCTFPDDWVGTYEGQLDIYKEAEITMSVPVKMNNHYLWIDTLAWTIQYGDQGVRDYRLYQQKPTSKGHYIIDEQNGILLDLYTNGCKAMTHFEVMGNVINTSYTADPIEKTIDFEIFFYPSNLYRKTGGVVFGQDTIPDVKSFPIGTYQKALLRQKK